MPHANVTFVPFHLTQTTKGQHIHKVAHGTVSGTANIHHGVADQPSGTAGGH